MPSDVTAVVLTLGEDTTERALESIRRQTLPPAETVVVEGVSPFFRALNSGVERVRTPFFVQVDADMVLDATCVERLRATVTSEVGIAVGALRDPLLGTIAGVKLFRRECFELTPMPDTVTPDVDFYVEIARHGWQTLFALSYDEPRHTFGAHLPAWTEEYTYSTYHLLGCRYRRHRDLGALLWRLGALRRSSHPMAGLARYALCTGLFYRETRDAAKSSVPLDRPLLDALARPAAATAPFEDASPRTWLALGRSLGRKRAHDELLGRLNGLAGAMPAHTWLAEVFLCYGFARGAASGT